MIIREIDLVPIEIHTFSELGSIPDSHKIGISTVDSHYKIITRKAVKLA